MSRRRKFKWGREEWGDILLGLIDDFIAAFLQDTPGLGPWLPLDLGVEILHAVIDRLPFEDFPVHLAQCHLHISQNQRVNLLLDDVVHDVPSVVTVGDVVVTPEHSYVVVRREVSENVTSD